MSRNLTRYAKLLAVLSIVCCLGCNQAIKGTLINQAISVLSAVTAAGASSLLQGLFPA